MDDIFLAVREGDNYRVKTWLDNTENDLNIGDDHRFSLLHWASMMGHFEIADALLYRGARVNATNMGGDTPLHLAASHGHTEIGRLLVKFHASVTAVNAHGNTPLHYACFWNYQLLAEFLIEMGANVCQSNKYQQIPLDVCKATLAQHLKELARISGQDLKVVPFKEDREWLHLKTRSGDASLSRTGEMSLESLQLQHVLQETHSGITYKAVIPPNTEVVAKFLRVPCLTIRNVHEFNEEYPRLRIFNHPNVLPLLAVCSHPGQDLVLISSHIQYGTLFQVLHGSNGIVIDQSQALRFALDVAKGMEHLHMMEPAILNLHLNSKHIMVDEDLARISDPPYLAHSHKGQAHTMIDNDLSAKINMADYKFSFLERHQLHDPAWMSPEALTRAPSEINTRASDMWSFGILLWELATREVPFAELSPMECGMKIATENLRVPIPPGISKHIERLITICTNENPGKRPQFDMVIPVLQKMRGSSQ